MLSWIGDTKCPPLQQLASTQLCSANPASGPPASPLCQLGEGPLPSTALCGYEGASHRLKLFHLMSRNNLSQHFNFETSAMVGSRASTGAGEPAGTEKAFASWKQSTVSSCVNKY